jgi:hypothetical protein
MTAEDKSKNSELEKGPTEKQEETFRRAKEVYKQVRRISTNEWDAKGPKFEKKRRDSSRWEMDLPELRHKACASALGRPSSKTESRQKLLQRLV